ncbi:MAG: hypothetical protein E7774_00965 [Bradyrhizobium sp.]|nr:MAG: hypothetical protein E7774_00965 [Bradyrhizobium sp.]
MDIYLQPHSDDVCFSLGALASRRPRGTALTICPTTAYVPLRPGTPAPSAERVTAIRMAEDREFCQACGFEARFLDLPVSSLLGHDPFDLSRVEENAARIGAPLIEALFAFAEQGQRETRPWLYCPGGIGDHVDHVATLAVVMSHYRRLSARYRIAFYEDLPYAANRKARKRGIERLLDAAKGFFLRRQALPLGPNDRERKLALIHLYPSQFLDAPVDLAAFTPALGADSAPHEALWSEERHPGLVPAFEARSVFVQMTRALPPVLRRLIRHGFKSQ